MQEQWVNYRDMIYPKGISALQNAETHQAFFAGALSFWVIMEKICALPDSENDAAILKLTHEVLEISRARIETVKARN